MAYIVMEDINQLWYEITDHSWLALRQTLQDYKNRVVGIEDEMVDQLISITQTLESLDQEFPKNPKQLEQLLNNHFISEQEMEDEDME